MNFELIVTAVAVTAPVLLFFLFIRKIRFLTIPRSFKCFRAIRCETTRVSRSRVLRFFDYILPTKRYYCKTCNQTFTRIVP
ncbi:MAG: hypothetical protein LAT75_08745 [Candidatus Cyclonatronum sp.]|uniref:hypothetical protein n=1 Tax=Cyclonatronum sp. TaxID=3024185 RepID=UPI0025BF5C94|nr:hypothetical protein [Cyclonatronum sp.]MCC5934330.1 hypothetical protein [Balneolales bacterium]MCH8486941.1 hypothetical protein [Cyclonatronum sp.]